MEGGRLVKRSGGNGLTVSCLCILAFQAVQPREKPSVCVCVGEGGRESVCVVCCLFWR